MILILNTELEKNFPKQHDLFDHLMSLQGKKYRALENRCTQKISLQGKNYFIKQHFGIGWKEIFKNLLQGRLPIISAKNEWLAISRLHSLNIATQTAIGYGSRGYNPAKTQSFLITQELPAHVTLEDFCHPWKTQKPSFQLKNTLLCKVASIMKTLHENGINHRDCYLCHFLWVDAEQKLYLIDLHRAQIRKRTPKRWMIKDLAGLYFSSQDIGLTKRDFLRFIKEYRNKPLRAVLNKEWAFWQKVKQRGDQLYRKHGN